MILILIVLIASILSLYIFITWNFDYWFKLNVPSPATRVLLGDLPNEFLRRLHVCCDVDKIYKYDESSNLKKKS